MKFLVTGTMPVETGNQLIRSGKLPNVIQSIMESIKPEAVYFTLKDGRRSMVMIVEMTDASQIPSIGEPMFLAFNGNLEVSPVMTPADLMKAGPAIEAAVKKFGS